MRTLLKSNKELDLNYVNKFVKKNIFFNAELLGPDCFSIELPDLRKGVFFQIFTGNEETFKIQTLCLCHYQDIEKDGQIIKNEISVLFVEEAKSVTLIKIPENINFYKLEEISNQARNLMNEIYQHFKGKDKILVDELEEFLKSKQDN